VTVLSACAPMKTVKPPGRATDPPLASAVVGPPAGERFISVNVPNLHYVEDDWAFDARDRFRLPSDFEIRDALMAVRQLGGNVVRIYALSVRKSRDPEGRLRHVLGPGVFDERAFVALDRVLQIAGELGVRVIVPFVDNWQWWGGVNEYAEFRGLPREAFWTDEQLIADFERTIEFLLTRKNTLTGVVYRDDPAVYAWETGNELRSPYAWTARIASFLKTRDRFHPVIDGFYSDSVRDEAIEDPNVDLLTTHHYATADETMRAIARNVERIAGRKPYFVGEFGLLEPADVRKVLGAVLERDVLGALLWSLRFHRDEGGFYWHAESGPYEAYHWPGFASGEGQGERAVLAALRQASFAARHEPEPPWTVPPPPTLLPIHSVSAISWQGSAGASGYAVQRATDPNGEWSDVAEDVSDARFPYRPLWSDPTARLGDGYYYRVVASNAAGASTPSNVFGPVIVETLTWIDELEDGSHAQTLSTGVELTHDDPRAFRMDHTRARGPSGALIAYQVPGGIREVRVFAFEAEPDGPLGLEGSRDGVHFSAVSAIVIPYREPDSTSRHHPVLYRATPPRGVSRVRIRLRRGTELGRVEIDYGPLPDR
jgi:mannan endo-1,4-beta-mannosidase